MTRKEVPLNFESEWVRSIQANVGERGKEKLTIFLVLVNRSMFRLAPVVAYFLRAEVPVDSSIAPKKHRQNA